MAEESKGIALAILGVVAVIAIVGLVLLFAGAKNTGDVALPQFNKVYGGATKGVALPYGEGRAISGAGRPGEEPQVLRIPSRKRGWISIPSDATTCGQYLVKSDYGQKLVAESRGLGCSDYIPTLDGYCCEASGLETY
ncbi:hypothetical protein KY314_04295 [Candidatus Woesearchaeota archaeon]|nr:hypothetical protein [Candidatus Woesearchaeota archaeon]